MKGCDDEERFRVLYSGLYAEILGYLARRLGGDEAVDAAADVFLTVWRRIEDVPDGADARLWLFGVARNVVRNRRRTRGRFWRFERRLSVQPVDPPESPEVVVVRNSEGDSVLEALGRLRGTDQELLRLVAWEELSHGEIGEILDCSTHAVDQRIHRALRRLSAAMRATEPTGARSQTNVEEGWAS